MKKKLQILVSIFLAINLLLLSCSKEDEVEIEERYKLNLTMEEKIEDYEYFWGFIYNGFPMIEVVERQGVDLEKIKKDGYEELSTLKSKNAYINFYSRLCWLITDKRYTGHLGAMSYNRFNLAYRGSYPVKDENGLNPLIDNFYVDKGIDATPPEIMQRMKKEQKEKTKKINANKKESKSNKTKLKPKTDTRRHYSLFADTEIIEKNKIAYLRIDTFLSQNHKERDAYYKALDKFFSETKNYKHLIIDVTNNSGGFHAYWEYIVAVHSRKKETQHEIYALYTKNKYNKYYFDLYLNPSRTTFSKIEEVDIESVPNVENANTKLHKKAFRTIIRITSIYAIDDKPREDRKIWVLISNACYSATDRFANFCKQSGWATLVGENTSGLGACSLGPVALPLPKSGLMILWDPVYGLNDDGTCNDEFGVAPDIYTEKGKTALETCLDAIEKYNKEHGE